MARNLVYSQAERLWQEIPPRNHMPARQSAFGVFKEEDVFVIIYECFIYFA